MALTKIEPLKWAGTCPYCSEERNLYRCTFEEAWSQPLVEDICRDCIRQLNDLGRVIPAHPLDHS